MTSQTILDEQLDNENTEQAIREQMMTLARLEDFKDRKLNAMLVLVAAAPTEEGLVFQRSSLVGTVPEIAEMLANVAQDSKVFAAAMMLAAMDIL